MKMNIQMREYVNYELLVLLPLLIYLYVILSHIKNMYFFHLFVYSTILKKMPQRKEAASEFQCWAISASTFGDKCGMAEGLRG